MIRVNEKSLFSGIIFLFVLVMLWNTIGMRNDVVLVPRIAGFLLLIFSGIQLTLDMFPRLVNKLSHLSKSADPSIVIGGEGTIDEEKETKSEFSTRYLFVGWMVLFVVLIFAMGMIYALAISLFIYLKWISKQNWMISILYPIIMAIIIYVSFVVGLDVYYLL